MADRIYVRVPKRTFFGTRTDAYVPLTEDIVVEQAELLGRRHQHNRYEVARGIATLNAEARIFGSPMLAWQYDPVPGWANVRGSRLEEAVSASANLLAYHFPGARIFHSVSLSENKIGEMDTVIIYQGRVLLLEAKHLSGTKVRMAENGRIVATRRTADGGVWKEAKWGSDNLRPKVAKLQETYPDLVVEGLYVFFGTHPVKAKQVGAVGMVGFSDLFPFLVGAVGPKPKGSGVPVVESARKRQMEDLSARLLGSRRNLMAYTKHAEGLMREGVVFPKVVRKAWSLKHRLIQTWKLWTYR